MFQNIFLTFYFIIFEYLKCFKLKLHIISLTNKKVIWCLLILGVLCLMEADITIKHHTSPGDMFVLCLCSLFHLLSIKSPDDDLF